MRVIRVVLLVILLSAAVAPPVAAAGPTGSSCVGPDVARYCESEGETNWGSNATTRCVHATHEFWCFSWYNASQGDDNCAREDSRQENWLSAWPVVSLQSYCHNRPCDDGETGDCKHWRLHLIVAGAVGVQWQCREGTGPWGDYEGCDLSAGAAMIGAGLDVPLRPLMIPQLS